MGNSIVSTLKKVWEFIKEWTLLIVMFLTTLFVMVWAVKGAFSEHIIVRVESYIRIILLICGVIAFGVLRLYNSHVANTRMLLKLRQAIHKLELSFSPLERGLRNNSSSIDRNSGLLKGMTTHIGELDGSVEHLDQTIERLNSIGKRDGK